MDSLLPMVTPDLMMISGAACDTSLTTVDHIRGGEELMSFQRISEPIQDSQKLWEAALQSRQPELLLSLMGSKKYLINSAIASAAATRLNLLCSRQTSRQVSSSDSIYHDVRPRDSAYFSTNEDITSCSTSLCGYGVLSYEHKCLYQKFLFNLGDLCLHHSSYPCDGFTRIQAVRLLTSLASMGKCSSSLVTRILQSSMFKLASSDSSLNMLDINEFSEANAVTTSWIKGLSSWQCLDLCWALATLRYQPSSALMVTLYDRTMDMLPALGFSQASSLLWSLSRLRNPRGGCPPPSADWWVRLEAATQLSTASSDASGWIYKEEHSNVSSSPRTSSRMEHSGTMRQLSSRILVGHSPVIRPDLITHDLSSASQTSSSSSIKLACPGQAVALLWAAARLEPQPRPSVAWVRGLLSHLGPQLSRLRPREKSMLLTGLSRLRYKPPDSWVSALLIQSQGQGNGNPIATSPRQHRLPDSSTAWPYNKQSSPHSDITSGKHLSPADYDSMLRSAASLKCGLPRDNLETVANIMQVRGWVWIVRSHMLPHQSAVTTCCLPLRRSSAAWAPSSS